MLAALILLALGALLTGLAVCLILPPAQPELDPNGPEALAAYLAAEDAEPEPLDR